MSPRNDFPKKNPYSEIRKYVHISMNNNLYTLALARFPNLANVQVIVGFTIIFNQIF